MPRTTPRKRHCSVLYTLSHNTVFRPQYSGCFNPSGKLGCSVEITSQREISILSPCSILTMSVFTGQINHVAHHGPQSIFTDHRDSAFIPFYLIGSQQCQTAKSFSFCRSI